MNAYSETLQKLIEFQKIEFQKLILKCSFLIVFFCVFWCINYGHKVRSQRKDNSVISRLQNFVNENRTNNILSVLQVAIINVSSRFRQKKLWFRWNNLHQLAPKNETVNKMQRLLTGADLGRADVSFPPPPPPPRDLYYFEISIFGDGL